MFYNDAFVFFIVEKHFITAPSLESEELKNIRAVITEHSGKVIFFFLETLDEKKKRNYVSRSLDKTAWKDH